MKNFGGRTGHFCGYIGLFCLHFMYGSFVKEPYKRRAPLQKNRSLAEIQSSFADVGLFCFRILGCFACMYGSFVKEPYKRRALLQKNRSLADIQGSFADIWFISLHIQGLCRALL